MTPLNEIKIEEINEEWSNTPNFASWKDQKGNFTLIDEQGSYSYFIKLINY